MLKLWELPPSPNNTKVRMALRFKDIAFEAVSVDPLDRQAILQTSGQEGTPVIEERGMVLSDSEAILQYLDANYPDSPRLLPRMKVDRRACEDWQKDLGEKVAEPWFPVFAYCLGMRDHLDESSRSRYLAGLKWLDEELAEQENFRNCEDGAINDLRVAQWATYALPGEGLLKRVPLFGEFKEVFAADAKAFPRLQEFLLPWQQRLA